MSRRTLSVGLIGCGAIGTVLAKAIDEGEAGDVKLLKVYDINIEKAEELAEELSRKPKVARSAEELIEDEDIDLIIEAASQQAVRQYATRILEARKDMMIMSIGALVDSSLLEKLDSIAEKEGRRIFLPSGAIAGLDAVKSASRRKIYEAMLVTTKPPSALRNAPFFEKEGIDVESIKERRILYEGPAKEACELFPSNVNVAAALSLAGIGPERTRVRVVADPGIDKNIHEVIVKGEVGELRTRVENVPSPDNPKTSYLACLSAISTLRRITSSLSIGT